MSSIRERWFKMYPGKYLDATRHMTLEQRGAYMDHICIMMERDGPLPDDMNWLAHRMHVSSRKARAIVEELIVLQKIKRTAEGLTNDKCEEVIGERRAQSEANAEAARKREAGKRDAAQQQPAVKGVFADVSRTVREDFTAEPELNQTRTVAENSKKANKNKDAGSQPCLIESTTRAPAHADEDKDKRSEDISVRSAHADDDAIDNAFEEFWQSFPTKRRRGKVAARKKFVMAVTGKRDDKVRATPEEVVAAVKAGRGIDPEYPPLPETWLNQGRWLDDDPNTQTAPDTRLWWQIPEKIEAARNDQRKYGDFVRQHANGAWPVSKLGPTYGQPGSLVSRELAEELGLIGTYDQHGRLRPGRKPNFSAHST